MRIAILLLLLALTSCAAPAGAPRGAAVLTEHAAPGPLPTADVARGGVIAVTAERDAVVVDIDRATIGSAVLTRRAQRWPGRIVLRVHSAGLESIAITAGGMKLAASYSSQPGHATLAALWKDGVEGPPLTPRSPYWMGIAALDAAGRAANTIPLPAGHFEMQIPAALLETQPATISLQWIDFYR